MKKFFIIPFVICLCCMLCLNVFAASTYEITDRKTLQNFEDGDPVENNMGGNTGWGGHWIETELSATDGLEGSAALKMDFGGEGTIGGVHADNIGTTEELNDWTPGMALLYRVKNPSSSSLNVGTTIDVNDENSAGRARVWQDGVQILLDTSYNPVETVYADALANDGETTAGRKLYVTIPAGFEGYLLWDLSKYVSDEVEQPFESIVPDTTVNPNWRSEVKHIVILVQDCHNKSLIVDDFRLVDYELVEIAEDVPQEETEPIPLETEAPVTVPVAPEAPPTGDSGIIFLLLFAVAGAAVTKNRLAVRKNK